METGALLGLQNRSVPMWVRYGMVKDETQHLVLLQGICWAPAH